MTCVLVQWAATLALVLVTLVARPVEASPLSGNIDDLLAPPLATCGDAISCLHAALDRSSTGITNPEDALPAMRSGGPRTDAVTGAWLIVDEALNLARLEVAPEAGARPVSIQRRLAAGCGDDMHAAARNRGFQQAALHRIVVNNKNGLRHDDTPLAITGRTIGGHR